MTSLNLNPFLLFSIFVLVPGTLFSPCLADEHGSGLVNDTQSFMPKGDNATDSWSNSTSQIQNENSLPTDNSTLPLAAERTRRIDPLTHLKHYEGGWDITNEHYFTSVLFSGTPLFAMAFLWFLIVGISFIILACRKICRCCRKKSTTNDSRRAYKISLILLAVFFTITIFGGIFLYFGQDKFHRTTSDVANVLVTKANTVIDIVHDVVANLEAAKKLGVGRYSLPNNIKQRIGQVGSLSNLTAHIKIQTEETAKITTDRLHDVSRSLVTLSVLMLSLAVIGFIISIFRWKIIAYILFVIGWLLVTLTLMLCGVSLIVQNVVGDTCVAMEEWVQHPRSHTAISKLLPCMDKSAAQRTLDTTKNTSFQIVNLVNAHVITVANANVPPSYKDVYYNQSGPLMPPLCNPLYPNLTERACRPSEVDVNSAPTAYQGFVCDVSPSGLCITMGRLTPTLYDEMMVATNMSTTLHRHGPFLVRLADCSFVVETFAHISKEACPSLTRHSSQVFIGLLLVSVAVMFSVILWPVSGKGRRFHKNSKKVEATPVEVQ